MSEQYNAPPPMASYPEGNGLAVASLVLGIVGLVILCTAPVTSLAAVICGHMALGRIRRGQMPPDSKALAIAGLILGYVALIVLLMVVAFYVLLFGIAIVGSQL